MTALTIIAFALMLLSVWFLQRSWLRLRNRQWLRAGLYSFPVTFSLFAFFLVLLVISNLTIYQRLTHEREIAILSIVERSDQRYEVTISYKSDFTDTNPEIFAINGDEWVLEARILKWLGWANLLGLDSYYQLDRIRGRYRNIEQEVNQAPTVYSLADDSRGINLWRLKQIMKSALPFLDAYYGQAVYLPLEDGAQFTILINQSGLMARPRNEIARDAVNRW